jgi:hypothetical protein
MRSTKLTPARVDRQAGQSTWRCVSGSRILDGDEEAPEPEAMEWLRDEYHVAQARFSPDSRFIAYLSDEIEADVFQVYVEPFDASEPDGGRGGATPVQVSPASTRGMIS